MRRFRRRAGPRRPFAKSSCPGVLSPISAPRRSSFPHSIPFWAWSQTGGLRGVFVRGDSNPTPDAAESPRGVLDFTVAHEGAAIFHLQDFHEPLRDSPEIRRRLREVYQSCLERRKYVVLSSPVRLIIPWEGGRSVVFLNVRPPDPIQLMDYLRGETGESNEAILRPLASALQGLTLDEARYALRRALAVTPRPGPESLRNSKPLRPRRRGRS